MLEFPRWKVWLVSLVVALGVLLSIPSLIAGTPYSASWPKWLPQYKSEVSGAKRRLADHERRGTRVKLRQTQGAARVRPLGWGLTAALRKIPGASHVL